VDLKNTPFVGAGHICLHPSLIRRRDVEWG